jgi:hypothetical protein
MRVRDELLDLGLGFYLGFGIEEGEEGDALEAFHTEDVAQRPSIGHNVT